MCGCGMSDIFAAYMDANSEDTYYEELKGYSRSWFYGINDAPARVEYVWDILDY